MQRLGKVFDKSAVLVSGIVKDNGNGDAAIALSDFYQKVTNTLRIDVCFGTDHNEFMGYGIQCPKHIKTFSPRRGFNK